METAYRSWSNVVLFILHMGSFIPDFVLYYVDTEL